MDSLYNGLRLRAMRLCVRLSFAAMNRALCAVSRLDAEARRALADLPDGAVLALAVDPDGARTAWVVRHGTLQRTRAQSSTDGCTIAMKSLQGAFLLTTGRLGPIDAYCRKLVRMRGDTEASMTLARCMHITAAYMLPSAMCRRLIRRVRGAAALKPIIRLRIPSLRPFLAG